MLPLSILMIKILAPIWEACTTYRRRAVLFPKRGASCSTIRNVIAVYFDQRREWGIFLPSRKKILSAFDDNLLRRQLSFDSCRIFLDHWGPSRFVYDNQVAWTLEILLPVINGFLNVIASKGKSINQITDYDMRKEARYAENVAYSSFSKV